LVGLEDEIPSAPTSYRLFTVRHAILHKRWLSVRAAVVTITPPFEQSAPL
jgi:hypothetical protein